jgi:hypothetical protein
VSPVELLPPGGLDQSIVLAVLLGVWITLLFTETLGWVFVGLVVPGYLASVLVVQPSTAVVIVIEALATYGLARGLAYGLRPMQAWTPFFGRDRFFVIVVASVLVRQHDQLWLMPALKTWIEGRFALALPPAREFYSIGLVLVPLTANLLWKPGPVRGLAQLGVVTGLTYLVLAYVLMPWTNLSMSSFELLYEDTAVDFLGNAKAYILMLTTALLAARFNLRYGWDFGGILIPALLGLLWFTPVELAITLVETCVLWVVASGLLRLLRVASWNIEGPRKVVVVFTLAVALKWLLSLVVGTRFPGLRAHDLFGFGYLLTSLLVLRMLHQRSARRVLLPAMLTGLLGWIAGSVVGFGLDLVAPVRVLPASAPRLASGRLLRTPLGAMALARVQAELASAQVVQRVGFGRARLDPDAAAAATAWTELAAWSRDPAAMEPALAAAAAANLLVVPLRADAGQTGRAGRAAVAEEGLLAVLAAGRLSALKHQDGPAGDVVAYAVVVAEQREAVGPVVLLRPGAAGPVLAVPFPVGEAPTAEAAALLAGVVDARAVVVAGRDGGDAVFAVALARLAGEAYLELRAGADVPRDRPVVYVEDGSSSSGELQALGRLRTLGTAPSAVTGPAWGAARRKLLRVHPALLTAALARGAPTPPSLPALLPWLAAHELGPGVRPVPTAAPPSLAELVFIERRVAGPLLRAGDVDERRVAARMAGLVDYELREIRSCDEAGTRCEALVESWRPLAMGWGTMVFRPRSVGAVLAAPYAAEEPGTARLAAEVWATAAGQALILGGGDEWASHAPAQALHQAALTSGGESLLHVRGLGRRPGVDDASIVIGLGKPVLDPRPLPPGLASMLAEDGALGWVPAWRLADGSPELAPLAGAGNAPMEFASNLAGQDPAVLWVPPGLREAYAPYDPCPELTRLTAIAAASGCQAQDEEAAVFAADDADGAQVVAPQMGFAQALAQVEGYAADGDLHRLRAVIAAGWTLRAGVGRATGRGFVVLHATWPMGHVEAGDRALVWLGPVWSALPRTAVELEPLAVRRALWIRGRTLVIEEAS